MAIQDKTLTGAEHDWFATRSGLTNSATLTAHKKAYFALKGFSHNKPLTQAEREWLQNIGSSSSNNPYELWSRACSANSATVGKTINSCKFNFYTTVSTSP
jgi:hypothetical protein